MQRKTMQRLWILVVSVTMMASAAWAQIPTKGNVFFGYSYDHTPIASNDTSNLNDGTRRSKENSCRGSAWSWMLTVIMAVTISEALPRTSRRTTFCSVRECRCKLSVSVPSRRSS